MMASVIVFPGSNCDRDVAQAFSAATGETASLVWHEDVERLTAPIWVLPGGFAHGDYLRAGAIAALSGALQMIPDHIRRGGLVLGICNGFQVLVEAGILPGAFLQNECLHFISRDVHLRVASTRSPFTAAFKEGEVLDLPIAHGFGNFRLAEEEARELLAKGRIAFQYATPGGEVTPEANPNGSVQNIAGIFDPTFRVLGMMPHPERNAEAIFGTAAGAKLFTSAISALGRSAALA